MNRVPGLFILWAGLWLTGCGEKPTGSPVVPLTVEAWKAMPVEQKYTTDTLERLKAGDPKLDTPEGWNRFSRTTLVEARKRDFPKGKKGR